MASLYVTIPDRFIKNINDLLGKAGRKEKLLPLEIVSEALAVYLWMLEQKESGASVGAAGADNRLTIKIGTPGSPPEPPRRDKQL